MAFNDSEFKVRSEQTTYRVLIGSIATVIISIVAGTTVRCISGDLAQPPIVPDLPAGRIQVKGDRPQRFEFVDRDGRVVASIVVQP